MNAPSVFNKDYILLIFLKEAVLFGCLWSCYYLWNWSQLTLGPMKNDHICLLNIAVLF